jgi:hypothetical protein
MKQELLDYLNAELSTYVYLDKSIDINVQEYCKGRSALITNLIAATEAAIFNLPSEEEIRQAAQKIGLKAIALPTAQALAFIDGCNFILTYKKNENDGK